MRTVSGTRVTFDIVSPETQQRARRIARAKWALGALLLLAAVAAPSPWGAARH